MVKRAKKKKSKLKKLLQNKSFIYNRFSRANLAIFALMFAAIGGYIIWRSFAVTGPTIAGEVDVPASTATSASIQSAINNAPQVYTPTPFTPSSGQNAGITLGPTQKQAVVHITRDQSSGDFTGGNVINLTAPFTMKSQLRFEVDSGVDLVMGWDAGSKDPCKGCGWQPGGVVFDLRGVDNTKPGLNNVTVTVGDTSHGGGYHINGKSNYPTLAGKFMVDISHGQTDTTLPASRDRAVWLSGTTNFEISHLYTLQFWRSNIAAVEFGHSNGWPKASISHGVYTDHYNSGSPAYWGPNQFYSTDHLYIKNIWTDGGTALRMETDGTGSPADDGGAMGNFSIDATNIYGQNGNRSISFTPHCADSSNITISNVYGDSQYDTVVFGGLSSEDYNKTTGAVCQGINSGHPGAFTNTTVNNGCGRAGPNAELAQPTPYWPNPVTRVPSRSHFAVTVTTSNTTINISNLNYDLSITNKYSNAVVAYFPSTLTLPPGSSLGSPTSTNCASALPISGWPPPAGTPTVSLFANPSSVVSGNSSTLSWSSTNVTSCNASGAWSGSKATSGSQSTGALTSASTYNLSCTGAGGSANASTTITVTPPPDTTPPTVSITAPAAGATVQGTSVTISANASDNPGGSGMASVQFTLDGNSQGPLDTSAPYSTIWNTTTLANGNHSLSAVARDNAGNTANAPIVSVIVNNPNPPPPDTTPPSVPTGLSSPAKSTTTVNLAWNPSTDNSGGTGVGGYQIYRNTVFITNVSGGPTTFVDSGLSPNTSYSYQVAAYDNASPPNVSAKSSSLSVTTNALPPTVSISANPTSITSGQSSTLTWSSTNASSCTASGAWSGSKSTSGTQSTGNLSVSSTYTLTCTGTGGTAANSAGITVNGLPPPPPPPPPPPTYKIGDLNQDGAVDVLDLSILLTHYNATGTGDINGDGVIDVLDLSILLTHYGG